MHDLAIHQKDHKSPAPRSFSLRRVLLATERDFWLAGAQLVGGDRVQDRGYVAAAS